MLRSRLIVAALITLAAGAAASVSQAGPVVHFPVYRGSAMMTQGSGNFSFTGAPIRCVKYCGGSLPNSGTLGLTGSVDSTGTSASAAVSVQFNGLSGTAGGTAAGPIRSTSIKLTGPFSIPGDSEVPQDVIDIRGHGFDPNIKNDVLPINFQLSLHN